MSTEPTTTELLAAVNTAIRDIATGKVASATVRGQSYTYQSLGDLRLLRKDLLEQVAAESGTGHGIRLGQL